MPSVGKSLPRKDAWDKVTAQARYIDDYSFPQMLYAATVRSPVAFGKLVSTDSTKAMGMPGVVKVVTSADIPGINSVPLVLADQPFLAEGFVRFHGEPVALVLAETSEQAYAAAEAVVCNIEKLAPALGIRAAMAPKAPKIYGSDNVFSHYTIKKGDALSAMAKADHVFEREYETPYQEHAYLETQGMIAVPGGDGTMTVYGTMQCPFYVHDAVSQALGIGQPSQNCSDHHWWRFWRQRGFPFSCCRTCSYSCQNCEPSC